jgi:hypothetical protein
LRIGVVRDGSIGGYERGAWEEISAGGFGYVDVYDNLTEAS